MIIEVHAMPRDVSSLKVIDQNDADTSAQLVGRGKQK